MQEIFGESSAVGYQTPSCVIKFKFPCFGFSPPHEIYSCIIFMRLIFKSRRETPIENRDQKFIFISFSDFNNFEIQRQLPSYLHNLIVSRFSQSIGLILYEINLCIVLFQFFKLISCLTSFWLLLSIWGRLQIV